MEAVRPVLLASLLALLGLVVVAGTAQALSNGDFETGNFAPWTFYSTWPPAQTAASGTVPMEWSRHIGPYAHDGNYGLRLRCNERGMSSALPGGGSMWYCDNGIQQTLDVPCGISLWFRISGWTQGYFGADLIVNVRDASGGTLTYVFDDGPNWAYDNAGGFRKLEVVSAGVWNFRALDMVNDFQGRYGRNLAAPLTLTLETYSDEQASLVDLDTVRVTEQCVRPPEPTFTNGTLTGVCGRSIEVWAGYIRTYDVSATSFVPAPNDWIWLFRTPSTYPAFMSVVAPSTANPAQGTILERVRVAPRPVDAGTYTFSYQAMDWFERYTSPCHVTIVVKTLPPWWETEAGTSVPCGHVFHVAAGDTIRYRMSAASVNRPVILTASAPPNTVPPNMATVEIRNGNPANGWFNWTTTLADAGRTHSVTWTARDDLGQFASPGNCVITVHVGDICIKTLQACLDTGSIVGLWVPLLAIPLRRR